MTIRKLNAAERSHYEKGQREFDARNKASRWALLVAHATENVVYGAKMLGKDLSHNEAEALAETALRGAFPGWAP